MAGQDADRGYRNGLRRAGWLGTRRRADVLHPMVSTLNVAVGALSALLLWTCLGAAITRRLAPGPLMLPMALVVGWAVHSVLALPLFRLIGLSTASVLAVALVTLAFAMLSARGGVPSGAEDMADDLADDVAVRVPRWAFALAALLALAPALAVMPKAADGGVILAGPIFDHAKVAMIDEMARLGVPPGNPFLAAGEGESRLVYYYLWHFSAAALVLAGGISGWEADIAMTWVTAFASLVLMMGLAVRFAGRGSAGFWIIPLAIAGSLRPLLSLVWSADRLDSILLRATGFGGWIFQSSWVPQHLMSACCIVAAVVLMGRLGERSVLRILTVALLAAAGFASSAWIGGVTFALAAPAVGAALLAFAEPGRRARLLVGLVVAALLTAVIAGPLLYDQLAAAVAREAGAPFALSPYRVLGEFFPTALRRALDLPAFWLIFLIVELPAIYLTGAAGLALLLARRGVDRPTRRDTLALALLAATGLAVSWLLVSTLGENDDLGWRAALPPVLVLTVFAAVALSQWIVARAWLAIAAALVGIGLGLPGGIEIVRDNVAGEPRPSAAMFAEMPQMWAAVRRHSIADERVGNNPLLLSDVTPWPVNIGWALLSNRRSCYAGREFALVFTALPAARRAEIDALFGRVFAGEGSADDVRDLATRYGCHAIALTAADGAWTRDPFAASPFYRLIEIKPDRWRVYRAVAPGDGGVRP